MEFLLTLLAFRPANVDTSPSDTPVSSNMISDATDTTEAASLYFQMFDVGDTGFINREELQFVIGILLRDEMKHLNADDLAAIKRDIEGLFETICGSDKEKITFADFKTFYDTCMASTTKLRLNRESLTKIIRNRVSATSIKV